MNIVFCLTFSPLSYMLSFSQLDFFESSFVSQSLGVTLSKKIKFHDIFKIVHLCSGSKLLINLIWVGQSIYPTNKQTTFEIGQVMLK